MKTWGNWPLDDSFLAIFGNPGFAVLGTLKNAGVLSNKMGISWEFVGEHVNSWPATHPLLGGCTPPWRSCVQDDASPEELEEYNLKLEAGDHRSTVEMGVRSPVWAMGYSLWTLSGQEWESLPPRKCQFVTHGPMGRWAHGHIMCRFFFSWPWDSAAVQWQERKSKLAPEEEVWMVRSQLGAVQLSYCSEKNQNDKHHLKKNSGSVKGPEMSRAFFTINMWRNGRLKFVTSSAAASQRTSHLRSKDGSLIPPLWPVGTTVFPEIWTRLEATTLDPQLQGLARPVAGLVPLPQNLAAPCSLDPLDRLSRTTLVRPSVLFCPVDFEPNHPYHPFLDHLDLGQNPCLFPGCGQGGQSDHPHDPRWHLFVGRSAQVGRPTNGMPTWVAIPEDVEISIYLSIYYLIYLFTLFVYLFNLPIN